MGSGPVAADLRAARALLQAQAHSHWRHALAGTLRDETRLIEAHQTATWLAGTCARIGETCFRLGGGAALYDASLLQRWMRDLQVSAQHAIAHRRHFVAAGRQLLRQEAVAPAK